MPNGRPGDSRSHDILHHRLEVFGPAIDGMVRAIDARLPAAERQAFLHLVDSWPFRADGTPHAPESLMQQLEAWRDRLGPEPPGNATTAVPTRRRGSPLAALIGLGLGGGVGIPLGFLAYLVLRETALPDALWSSEPVMWAVIATVALGAALLGAMQGGRPSRIGHALLVGLLGLFVGSLVSGLAAGVLAFLLGAALGVSQREGAFAMGVIFTLVPLAGMLGGLVLAIRMGRRAWRSWRG